MIYLATPYSHPDPAVQEQRFRWACRVAAELMRQGHKIFSPIAHSHPIAQYGLPKDWEFWKQYDTELVLMASEVWVVMMPGWDQSKGVKAEVELATSTGKPVRYLGFVEPV